jgi:hypothetical protein
MPINAEIEEHMARIRALETELEPLPRERVET